MKNDGCNLGSIRTCSVSKWREILTLSIVHLKQINQSNY